MSARLFAERLLAERSPLHQRGFLLLETLIGLLFAAFVISAIATTLLRQPAPPNARAEGLLTTMTEIIRANPRALAFYQGRAGFGSPCSSPCNPAFFAQAQLAQWQDSVARELPEGQGVVEAGRVVVSWQAAEGPGCPELAVAGRHCAVALFSLDPL